MATSVKIIDIMYDNIICFKNILKWFMLIALKSTVYLTTLYDQGMI